MQSARDGRAGGVVAGGGDNEVVGHRLDVRQWLAIDAGVGDSGRQIFGRVFAARRGDAIEVTEHVEQGRYLILVAAAAFELTVVAAEQLLGEPEHSREVRLGYAQQR